jgi:dTDP-4-dehydrorhamnose 3,5-epimerase
MNFEELAIPGVYQVEPSFHGDDRGFFMETYQAEIFKKSGIDAVFVQDNHSGSEQGILRGLHYQLRQPQGKLVRVVTGQVFDVAVDLRRSSPTFGKWVALLLSARNRLQLWIPPGFAHGFYVLSDWADLVYKVTSFYAPQWDRTLRWDDPEIGIDWPLIDDSPPVLSEKDQKGVALQDAEVFP